MEIENLSENQLIRSFVVKDLDEEKYNQKCFSKRFLALNKVEKDTYEDQIISKTYRRKGKDENIEENKKEIQVYLKNQMDFRLKSRYLEESQFFKVKNFLIRENMILKEYLNSGGEADVYLGWKINENAEPEEKVFRIIKAKSLEDIPKIQEEYKKVNAIFKPQSIIQYDGQLIIDKVIIFIMKKYSGSLKDKMKDKLTNHQFLKLTLNLFEGLIVLRVNNIIHSDIKPANILIDQIGQYTHCFYSDFGMCMKLQQKQELSGDIEGFTHQYCSPEQEVNKTISYASDMYSLGRVVLEMSEQLLDDSFKQTIQSFLMKNLLLENPEERISVEELIPQFVLATALNNDKEIIEQQISKIESSFKQDQLEFKVNTSKNLKVILSNKLVLIILNYLLMNQPEGITYNSLYENKFQGLNTLNIANLFYEIVCLPGNTLSCDKLESNYHQKNINKKKYLKDSLEVLQKIPISHLRDELLAKVLFYLGQLFLIEENFYEALENLGQALELSIITNLPQYLKYRIVLFLGKTHFYLKDQDSATIFFQSFEEIFAQEQSDKYSEITDQFLFAQTLEECGNDELSLKYYERITAYWDTIFGDEMNNVTNDQQCNVLKVVSQSYFKQQKFDEFLYVQIQNLRVLFKSEEGLYHFEVEVYKFQYILMQSDLDTVINQFDVLNDVYKEDPLFNKIMLVPFIIAFNFKSSLEKYQEAEEKFNSIKEEEQFPTILKLQTYLVISYNQFQKGYDPNFQKPVIQSLKKLNEQTKSEQEVWKALQKFISLMNSFMSSSSEEGIETLLNKRNEALEAMIEAFEVQIPKFKASKESEQAKSFILDFTELFKKKKVEQYKTLQLDEEIITFFQDRLYEAISQNSNNKFLKDSTFQQEGRVQNEKNDIKLNDEKNQVNQEIKR